MNRRVKTASGSPTRVTAAVRLAWPRTMAPKTATATAPPSERKKFIVAGRGAELVQRDSVLDRHRRHRQHGPIPTPTNASSSSRPRSGSADGRAARGRGTPSTARTRPTIGRPAVVADAGPSAGPAMVAPVTMPPISGISAKPDCAGGQPEHQLEIDRHVDRQADEGAHGEAGGGRARGDHRIEQTVERQKRLGGGRRAGRRRGPTAPPSAPSRPGSASSPRDSGCRPS